MMALPPSVTDGVAVRVAPDRRRGAEIADATLGVEQAERADFHGDRHPAAEAIDPLVRRDHA